MEEEIADELGEKSDEVDEKDAKRRESWFALIARRGEAVGEGELVRNVGCSE